MGAIDERGWKVSIILNTHAHADHTGANGKIKRITGAPIGIHKDDAEMLTHPAMKDMAGYLGLGASPEADILYKEGDTIDICPCQKLSVSSTPGHSPGGACFVHDDFVITGDTLFNMSIGRSDLQGGDLNALLNSIREKLFNLPDCMTIYPGHGEPSTIGHEKAHNPFVMGVFK